MRLEFVGAGDSHQAVENRTYRGSIDASEVTRPSVAMA